MLQSSRNICRAEPPGDRSILGMRLINTHGHTSRCPTLFSGLKRATTASAEGAGPLSYALTIWIAMPSNAVSLRTVISSAVPLAAKVTSSQYEWVVASLLPATATTIHPAGTTSQTKSRAKKT